MFKRLRERISEEASKSVAQLGNNSSKPLNESENKTSTPSTGDLITLNESSSVVLPYSSSQQFSIGEDDDGSMSEQSTPQKTQAEPSNGSTPYSTPSAGGQDFSFSQYRPKRLSYVPQSDIESEREDPPTLNLEGISKDQLLSAIDILKARTYKYKNKYSEVVKNFKELQEEKNKIEKTLIETQDKGSRRIAELREQCQLEQKAKAHLEENLRLTIEEKENRITVLETQITLLKDSSEKETSENQQSSVIPNDLLTGDHITSESDQSNLLEKLERLEHQLSQANKTMTAQTDQIALLRKQNENNSQELEEKVKRVNELEDSLTNLKKEHAIILKTMQIRLEELEKQQEESAMAMAETKKNMHEELEFKEKQLVKAKTEAAQHLTAVEVEKQKVGEVQKQYEGKIGELQKQLETTEKTLEEEKKNLMQDLARGKAAAVALLKKDCAQKIAATEKEWKSKCQELQSQISQVTKEEKRFDEIQEKLHKAEAQVNELNSLVIQLEQENEALKNSSDKMKSMSLETMHDENLKCLKDKYENAEKNYTTQMEEMKLRLKSLEKDKLMLEEEKKNLSKEKEELTQKNLNLSNQFCDLEIEQLEAIKKASDQENAILKLKTEVKSLGKGNTEKIETCMNKIKLLTQEREQLMHEAQERVSATEAKCREDLKMLQEKYDKIYIENKELVQIQNKCVQLETQLHDSLQNLETAKANFSKEITSLENQLTDVKSKLLLAENDKLAVENELAQQIEKMNVKFIALKKAVMETRDDKTDIVDNIDENQRLSEEHSKASSEGSEMQLEKESLSDRPKEFENILSSIDDLNSEKNCLKKENSSLHEQLESLKSVQVNYQELLSKFESIEKDFENSVASNKQLVMDNEKLKVEVANLKESLEKEISSLNERNKNLSQQINLLEKLDSSNPNSVSVKNYIASIREECDRILKAKEEETGIKLKILVHDFAEQMDLKDRDCDKITTEIFEKNQDLEERLMKNHRNELSDLRQALFEKECALDDIRDDYEEKLQERDKKIKEYEATLKNVSNAESGISPDSAALTAESSDWDDTWAVPDEVIENNTSPVTSVTNCEEHLQEIECLKDEVSKCNSEIKELKVLLRLSPPESMVNNDSRRDSLQSIPEPTEFEYLKNIIYEYMMGKEPITLVKVIAAVLRFSESQTQQVIRKEESRHQTSNHWMS